jgi:hypothetical protein
LKDKGASETNLLAPLSSGSDHALMSTTATGDRARYPIWKLEAALKCRSCKKGRHAPPVHMIKLTEAREITPYVWVHPDDDR